MKIIIASDIHYISPRITDHGACFMRVIQNADGKVTLYCEELVDAFVDHVICEKPDLVVFTGDLSFNGAIESHEDLAKKLNKIQKNGIKVLVLTGNHDMNNINAASFTGESFTRIHSAEQMNFSHIYEQFGFRDAKKRDRYSLSYIYELDEIRFLLVDTNTRAHPGGVSEGTLKWIREQLEDAKRNGKKVISFGHQNLLQHSFMKKGIMIENAEALLELFEEYHMPLFLSGHMHLQHIKTVGSVTEIATSSLSVAPNQYGVLEIGECLEYHTEMLDVSAYANKNGIVNADLNDFKTYAYQFMDRKNLIQCRNQLNGIVDEVQFKQLAVFSCLLNRAYFAGNLTSVKENGELNLWLKTKTPTGYYLNTIRPEIGKNYTKWSGKF